MHGDVEINHTIEAAREAFLESKNKKVMIKPKLLLLDLDEVLWITPCDSLPSAGGNDWRDRAI